MENGLANIISRLTLFGNRDVRTSGLQKETPANRYFTGFDRLSIWTTAFDSIYLRGKKVTNNIRKYHFRYYLQEGSRLLN